MTCTYGGIPCLDPAQEMANCRQRGYPTPWAGVANSFTCPQGQDYGRGRVLMLRGDLLSLNLNAFYPLVFNDGTRGVTLKQVLFVRAYCATPGGRGDPTEAYWCELADKRFLCHNPIDKAYNVRSTPGGSYYSATLNAGVAWTWSQMVGDIWTIVGRLGTFPGLPFTPNGTPEGWSFYGSDVFVALGQVLARLGCALDYDPIADKFSVARLGTADAVETSALKAVDPVCVWDSDPIEGTRAGVPGAVQIFFPKQRATADTTGASPFYNLLQTDPTAGGPLAGVDAGNVATIYDDLPAIYDAGGSLTNASALASRAAERAADYYRVARQTRLYRGYTGGYGTPGLLPGAQLTATIWRDTGGGLFTEVVRLPDPLGGDPFAGQAGATPGGGGLPGEPGQPGATGPGGEGTTVLLPPIFAGGTSVPASQPPWLLNLNYLYLLLYNQIVVAVGSGGSASTLEVKNIDNTQDTPGCTLFRANNDLGTGLLKWVTDAAGTGYLSWMGLQLYKAGTGLVGPETILEIQDDGGSNGVLATISDDATTGRVVLKYHWLGLTLSVGGTSYGPERILEVIPGTGVVLSAADIPGSNKTQLTITNGDPGSTALGDHKAMVSATDTTPNYLQPKLVAGKGITITKENPGGNEDLKIAVDMSANGGSSATIGSGTTGTTVASPGAVIFDITNGDGIIAGCAIRNTGLTNGLSYNLFVQDLYGNSGTGANITVAIQTTINFNTFTDLIGTVKYPYQRIKLTIQDQSAGSHTTYDVKLTRTS